MAEILAEAVESEAHAKSVIDAFDTNFPTAAQLKRVARDLGEKCRCGVAKWQHGEKGCGSWYSTADKPYVADAAEDKRTWKQIRDIVPMIPGQRWEVCLAVENIKVDLGLRALPPDPARIAVDEKLHPEAVAAIRAGRAPDYKLIEQALAKVIHRFGQVVKFPSVGGRRA
ncbi:MAG TPA: hypothetical protein VKB24_09975 [Candidatus Acidoferrum sp.]|nr:hypothetical protein [Candidatus Acidoferrum sp.]